MARSADLLRSLPFDGEEPSPPATGGDRLEQLCSGLADILRDAPGEASGLREELAAVIETGARELAARLRGELPCWSAALEELERLSRCRYLPVPDSLSAVCAELERGEQRARHIAEKLEALAGDPLPLPPEPGPRLLEAKAGSAETQSDVGVDGTEPADVDSVYARAEESRRRKDYGGAIALYSEVLRRKPGHPHAHRRRGQLRLFLKQVAGAVEDFTAVLRGQEDPEALFLRGDANALLGKLDEAVADYTRCLELAPERTRARFNRAVLYRIQGRLAEALEEFTEISRLQPDQEAPIYHRGLVHLGLERYERAIEDFTRTVELNPDHAEARARLREVRGILKERTSPVVETEKKQKPATEVPPEGAPVKGPSKPASPGDSGVLRVECPACGAQGAIRWEKLGRLHVCRSCSRSFRLDPSGGMVEVIRTRDNKWVDRKAHEARSRRGFAIRFTTRLILPVVAVAAIAVAGAWWSTRPVQSAEVELPRELVPRVELFAKSWLKKDWGTMRLLATPGQDRNLYKWSLRHAPPRPAQANQEMQVEAAVLATQGQMSTVKVRIRGTAGRGWAEEVQYWEDRGGAWYFMVPTRP